MKLIIGLGNPEKKYENTRHNAGFLAIDKLSAKYELPTPIFDKKTNTLIIKGEINKKRTLLAKPQTYMNDSGAAARALLDFYKLKPKDLIVIHDDKDIRLGETRIQTNRGPAGHNGVKSIIAHLGTQDFTRVRIGIASGKNKIKDTANFVLKKFTAEEKTILNKAMTNAIDEINKLI